jgi:CheY-like chemotaxis protein/HPt (histidine-containing phosphotransfer) domain-containing protein
MMGGSISVESEYGKGSVFTVEIVQGLADTTPIGEETVKRLSNFSYTSVSRTAESAFPDSAGNTAQCGKALVVDDKPVNLVVVKGLLAPYLFEVDTASSGKEALEKLRDGSEYGLIFMDHMMPEMDGVEATGRIRKLGDKYDNLPIIALTANAVMGAKEMFLSNGFNGFISKPIDMQEMIVTLKEWLPAEKVEERDEATKGSGEKAASEFITAIRKVNEINTDIGLSRVSGIEDMYRETVELFTKKLMQECDAMTEKLNNADMKGFSILVHAMKSVLSTIGAMNLSEAALRLETASKNNETEFCIQRFPALKTKLINLHEELLVIFPEAKEKVKKQKGNTGYLKENIEKALEAASDFDRDVCLKAIEDLLVYDFGEQSNTILEKAEAAVKEFNFDAVTELLNEIKEG